MTTRVAAIDTADAQGMIRAAEQAREAEAKEAAAKPINIAVHVPSTNRVTIRGDHMEAETAFRGQTTIPTPLRSGHVKLQDGTETTLEAARNAGLTSLIIEAADGVAQSFKEGSSPRAQATAPTETNGPATEPATLVGATGTEAAEIGKAAETLAQASEAIGPTAVSAVQHDVVSSGELPTVLPDGITQEMVDVVSKGYVAQANAVLRETGATVETMLALLNDNELKDARLATFRGDDAALKDLGGRALSRLHTVPDDPVLLKELTANWPADIQVVNRENVWWVESPTRGKIKWSDAVAQGKIRVQ